MTIQVRENRVFWVLQLPQIASMGDSPDTLVTKKKKKLKQKHWKYIYINEPQCR